MQTKTIKRELRKLLPLVTYSFPFTLSEVKRVNRSGADYDAVKISIQITEGMTLVFYVSSFARVETCRFNFSVRTIKELREEVSAQLRKDLQIFL